MSHYYFVGTLLSPLSFEEAPEITFDQLDALMHDNLSDKDYKKIKMIRHFFDILNLRSLWMEEELDSRGTLTLQSLDEALVNRIGFPQYVFDFIDYYTKKEERIHHFPLLLAKFFQAARHEKDRFLRAYFNFERELRLVITAFRAKKLGRNLSFELQYEDPEEDFIAQLLAKQDALSFEPPEKYKELKVVFEKHGDNPLALQLALDKIRFEWIESQVDMADVFSIERLLAYFVEFIIIERWSKMDKVKGAQIVNTIIKDNHGTKA